MKQQEVSRCLLEDAAEGGAKAMSPPRVQQSFLDACDIPPTGLGSVGSKIPGHVVVLGEKHGSLSP